MPKPGNVERTIGTAITVVTPMVLAWLATTTRHPELLIYGAGIDLAGVGLISHGSRVNTEYNMTQQNSRRGTNTNTQQNTTR